MTSIWQFKGIFFFFQLPVGISSANGLPNLQVSSSTLAYRSSPFKGVGAIPFSAFPLKAFLQVRYRCCKCKNLRCRRKTLFLQCFNRTESVLSSHIGHAHCPLTLYPERLPYAGKSLIVPNNIALKVNFSSMNLS